MMELENNGTNDIVGGDPSFIDPTDAKGIDDLWLTSDDGLNIKYQGHAWNSANDSFSVATTDILNNSRVIASSSDIGAYEFNYVFPCGYYDSLMVVENPIYQGVYKASGPITSNGSVSLSSSGPVEFNSTQEINLEALFEVALGQEFEAGVNDPCVD